LNRVIAPEFEIRFIKASYGGDTLAFMLLDRETWTALETSFGARVNEAFMRIEKASPFFAHAQAAVVPASPDAAAGLRLVEISERLKEGFRLEKLNKLEEAIAVFEEIDRRFGQDSDVNIRGQVAKVLVCKGDILSNLKRGREALDIFEQADRRFGKDEHSIARDMVSYSLVRRSEILKVLGTPEEVIAIIDQVFARFGADSSPRVRETVIIGLRNKMNCLRKLNRVQELIATYDETVRHFGDDTAPVMRAEVALALNGASFCRIMQAKQEWVNTTARALLLRRAVTDLRRALECCEEIRKVMVLGNLGYALYLSGDELNAARETQECLRLGGADALQGQRSDAAMHRLEVEDAAYEEMLTRIWKKLHPAGV
jgi:tetratricopeptide (TPR) repeat protein